MRSYSVGCNRVALRGRMVHGPHAARAAPLLTSEDGPFEEHAGRRAYSPARVRVRQRLLATIDAGDLQHIRVGRVALWRRGPVLRGGSGIEGVTARRVQETGWYRRRARGRWGAFPR